MSDLNLGPPPQSSLGKFVAIAVGVVAAVVAALFWFNPHHVSELTVEKTDLFAPHTRLQGSKGGVHVLGQAEVVENNLYVIATVRFKNTLRLPIDPAGASAILIDRNNQSTDGSLVAQRDLPRLNDIFPQLAAMEGHPLSLSRLAPGEERTGTLIFLFPEATDQDWKDKRSATMTIRLPEQTAQTAPMP